MVNLSITSTIVEALNSLSNPQNFENNRVSTNQSDNNSVGTLMSSDSLELGHQEDEIKPKVGSKNLLHKEDIYIEPDLSKPKVGNPISHHQIIALSTALKSCENQKYCLENLLKGSKIYMPPPPVEPEKTSEYKILMARLRRQDEARSYEKMTNHQSRTEPPLNFTDASAAHAFPNNLAISDTEDEVTYADVNRQVTLILNILLSIIACGAAIWIAARWLSTPVRLALSMGGSILVGIAEVVVYSGYLRRVGTAKKNEKSIVEKKEILETWVVKSDLKKDLRNSSPHAIDINSKDFVDESQVRRRRKHEDTKTRNVENKR